jgi:O-antigen ligase
MDVLMIGFLVWSLVTLSWADRFDAAQVTIQVYLMRFVLYLLLVSNQVRKKEDLEGVMNVLMLNGGFLIIAGIIGFLTGGFTEGARFKILGVNENGTGILLLVTLPGIFWKLRQKPSGSHNKIKTLLAFVYLFVVIGLVALSGSRGSAISYLITLLIFVFWKPTRPWLMLGLIIFLLAIIVAPFMFTVTIERFLGAEGNTVLGGREEIWPAGWQLIKDNPWFGVGIGNSPYAVTPYLYLTQPISTSSFTALHNPILVIWAETGIIGLFLYLGVMLSAVWLLVKQFFQHKAAGELYLMPYYAVVASVFIGFMASWFKGGGMESDYTYFLMLALMLIPSRLDIKNTEIEHSL